jgi:hypothetical protein
MHIHVCTLTSARGFARRLHSYLFFNVGTPSSPPLIADRLPRTCIMPDQRCAGGSAGYNILIILILKYGSANILWLAMTIMVPLGSMAFALPFVPGHKPPKVCACLLRPCRMGALFIARGACGGADAL